MTHPAEEARIHIMAALEACQADRALATPLGALAKHLASAQKRLFPACNLPADSPGCLDMMRRAMDALALGLKILQDIQTNSEAVGVAAGSIAKALQTLHPLVQKQIKSANRLSRPPGEISTDTADSIDVITMLSANTDHQFYTGFSEDIEKGGIFVATFAPREKGTDVVVNFKLPGNIPITAKGVVQFVRDYNPSIPEMPPGMGVKFTNLLASDKKAIEEFVQSRPAMFYDE